MTGKFQFPNFIGTAYACDPVYVPVTTDEKITNIEIFSNNDFKPG